MFEVESYSHLLEYLGGISRVMIGGRPGVGKSTLGQSLCGDLALPLFHTDDFLDIGFRVRPDYLRERFSGLGSYIIEGCDASRLACSGMIPEVMVWVERDVATRVEHRGIARTVINSLLSYPAEIISYRIT